MDYTRRELLALGTALVLKQTLPGGKNSDVKAPGMGIVIHSYAVRQSDRARRFNDPLGFLENCLKLGAAGGQIGIGVRDDNYAARVLSFLEKHHLYLEGTISLPRTEADLERFTAEIQSAKACGASVLRTVLMGGRRYEVYSSRADFNRFVDRSRQALAWVKPVIEKHELRLAVENHKDLRAAEQLEAIDKTKCPLIGICVDTGNSIALLENPEETAKMLAPRAFTTHFKDMAVEEYKDGFLLSEVPLGQGFLDLPKIIQTLRSARPDLHLNLEMITRDPLKIPCLTPKYWATLEDLPAPRLAEMLALVRAKSKKPLPRISGLDKETQLQREEENNRRSLQYAREKLGT